MGAPRPPKGEVVRNPIAKRKADDKGFKFALRFTAYGKRRYVTLGRPEDGWNEARAEAELAKVLADVRLGLWQPYVAPAAAGPAPDPTFHEFATDWFDAISKEIRPGTILDYEATLRCHLLPFFKDHRLSEITVAEVDRYREAKVSERALGATSINKTITRLGQILEVALEWELVTRNAAKVGGKRRKVKGVRPRRAYLDRAEQIEALLAAACELDKEAPSNKPIARRAMLATLVLGGLRIGELLALDWRDVDLASGRLRVREAKTDAGVRYIDLLPALSAELRSLKAARHPKPADPVFPGAIGTRLDRNRVRNRVLGHPARASANGKKLAGVGAVGRANERLLAQGLAALPEGLTPHSLRRTFGSLLIALGRDPAYVMAQMGHTDPTMTLGLYAQVMSMADGDRDRLRVLVEGPDLAVAGSGASNPAVAGGPNRPKPQERRTGVEPATSSLGSLRSTN